MFTWEGDRAEIERYVLALMPQGFLPGLGATTPWPMEIVITQGARADIATEIGRVDVGAEGGEPADAARLVLRQIDDALGRLPPERRTATITVYPVYDEEGGAPATKPVAITRSFQLRAEESGGAGNGTGTGGVFSGIGAALATAVAGTPPARPREDPASVFGGYEQQTSRVDPQRPIEYEAVRMVLDVLQSEIGASRAANAQLTGQLVNVLGQTVEQSRRDAERSIAEAHLTRGHVANLEKQLAQVNTERDMLRERVEELNDDLESVQETAKILVKRARRIKGKGAKKDPATDMFNEVVEQVVTTIREQGFAPAGEKAESKADAPATPPAPEVPGAPVAPRRRGRPRKSEQAASAAPAAAAPNPLGAMAGLFGGNFDPSQIADLIANLPPDMKAGIVGALANKYPAAAVNLAESIADATENKVRAERRARGEEDEDEEEEEEEEEDDDDGDEEGDEEGDDEEEEDEEDLDDLFDDGDDGDDGDDEEE